MNSNVRAIKAAVTALLAALLLGCGGGDEAETYSSPTSGSGATSGSGSGSGTGFYRRTNGTTALAINGSSSYFCAWDDCPGGVTCGLKVYGTDNGSTIDWRIPNGSGGTTLTSFGVTDTDAGLTLTYQGSRVGDYVAVSSWANATQGDGGYCSGTGSTGGGGSTTPVATTGQIAVWTSRSTGSSIAVSIDNASVGSLDSYFNSTPTCGNAGTITRTLSAGTHTLSATATGGSWGPSSFTITAGSCLTYQLQ